MFHVFSLQTFISFITTAFSSINQSITQHQKVWTTFNAGSKCHESTTFNLQGLFLVRLYAKCRAQRHVELDIMYQTSWRIIMKRYVILFSWRFFPTKFMHDNYHKCWAQCTSLLFTPLLFEYFSASFLYQHLMLLFPAKSTENIQGMKTLEYFRQKQYSFLLLISFCMTWRVIHFRRTWCVQQSLSLLYLFDTYCYSSLVGTRETCDKEYKENVFVFLSRDLIISLSGQEKDTW